MMKLRSYLGRKRRSYNNERVLDRYKKKFRTYNADTEYALKNGSSAERSILIQTHVIEKGLQHKVLKPLFGYNRISTIAKSLKEYLSKGGENSFVIGTAVSALETYNDTNRSFENVTNEDLIPIPEVEKSGSAVAIGAKEITREEFFKGSEIDFSQFCRSRHSLRMYDCKSNTISCEKILHCIETAQICPNACNRQAVRVKIVLDPIKIKEISKIQGGADGFGEHSGAMLLITSDISLYTMKEHNLAMVDCGIFIMNLVYALHEKKLGSCVLNCCMSNGEEAKLRSIVPVSDSEIFAAMISVSDIPENETVKIAHSVRRPVKDIVQIV